MTSPTKTEIWCFLNEGAPGPTAFQMKSRHTCGWRSLVLTPGSQAKIQKGTYPFYPDENPDPVDIGLNESPFLQISTLESIILNLNSVNDHPNTPAVPQMKTLILGLTQTEWSAPDGRWALPPAAEMTTPRSGRSGVGDYSIDTPRCDHACVQIWRDRAARPFRGR